MENVEQRRTIVPKIVSAGTSIKTYQAVVRVKEVFRGDYKNRNILIQYGYRKNVKPGYKILRLNSEWIFSLESVLGKKVIQLDSFQCNHNGFLYSNTFLYDQVMGVLNLGSK